MTRPFIVCQSHQDPGSTCVGAPSYLQKAEAKLEKGGNALQKNKCSFEKEKMQPILKAFRTMRMLHRTVSFLQRHTVMLEAEQPHQTNLSMHLYFCHITTSLCGLKGHLGNVKGRQVSISGNPELGLITLCSCMDGKAPQRNLTFLSHLSRCVV